MFRLGTRPDRKRTSVPPELSASSFSPLTVLIETGTSWMFSLLRAAVTLTVSRVAACWAALSCAIATAGNRVARATTRGRTTGARTWAERDDIDMPVTFKLWTTPAFGALPGRLLQHSTGAAISPHSDFPEQCFP